MAAPLPAPPAHPRPAEPPKVVAWQARVPPLEQACRVDAALLRLLPHRYPSSSAAKRAVRRREVLVDGCPAAVASM